VPTIKDVAKYAGLSRTTVSRVINDQPYVSDEKRQCVLKAMEELGYVPNSSARRLRSQKTETLAVLLPRITNPFFSHLIEAMEMKASQWGYQVIICQTHESEQKEQDYLELLRTKQVDGVIMTAVHNDWKVIESYRDCGPIVVCNENIEEAQVPFIYVNQEKAAYDATMHLIQQGCKNISFLSGDDDSNVSTYRRSGFLKALEESGLPFLPNANYANALDVNSGREIFRELRRLNHQIDGVFTGSDEVAAGMIYEAMKEGVRVPEDMSIIGFDNQSISMLMSPSITTVEQPVQEMGEKCIEVLIDQIEHRHRSVREDHVFAHELKVRNSTFQEIALVNS